MSATGGTAPSPCTARRTCDDAQTILVLSPRPISLNPFTLASRPTGSKDAEQRKRRQETAAEKESRATGKRKKKRAVNEAVLEGLCGRHGLLPRRAHASHMLPPVLTRSLKAGSTGAAAVQPGGGVAVAGGTESQLGVQRGKVSFRYEPSPS